MKLHHTHSIVPYRYLISLGSNSGNREHNFHIANTYLKEKTEAILGQSRWILTQAVPVDSGCPSLWPAWQSPTSPAPSGTENTSPEQTYLNAVCDVLSPLDPIEFLNMTQGIEDILGHDRRAKGLPRAMDIDILFAALHTHTKFEECDPLVVRPQTYKGFQDFTIPHARFWQRDFLLELTSFDLNISLERLRSVSDFFATLQKKSPHAPGNFPSHYPSYTAGALP